MNKSFFILIAISINLFSSSNLIKDKYGNEYKTITSPNTGKVWLDRNLGAEKVCETPDDKRCFGDYFQWGEV